MTAAKYTLATHLNHLRQFTKKQKEYQKKVSQKTFLTDEMAQDALLKSLERVLESVITISNMIIAEEDFKKPETKQNAFEILASEKVITKILSKKLEGVAGFRNILIHDYIDLNLKLAYRNAVKSMPVFDEFSKQIARHIKKS
ncbi:DUF86 domain-containing protein [Patescibacteria group bacterium]|nr:DUF86 domain-containing protein [Patescibacteria group bacterium]